MGILCMAIPVSLRADITNTASATYKDGTNASYNATSLPVVVTVISPPSLTLTKSASPTTVAPGGTVTYTIAYANNGGSSANTTFINDTIPSGSTFVPGSITGGGILSGGTITWNLGTVAAGGSGSVTFRVTAN